jgi:hypothetical protein
MNSEGKQWLINSTKVESVNNFNEEEFDHIANVEDWNVIGFTDKAVMINSVDMHWPLQEQWVPLSVIGIGFNEELFIKTWWTAKNL